MSFNITRDNNNKIVKTSKTINVVPSLNNSIGIGSTGNTKFASINTLSLNSVSVQSTGVQLNFVNTTPGSGKPLKALILDSSSNINSINNISCNSLVVNGTNITKSLYENTSSDDVNNPFMTNITLGIAKPSKALLLDKSINIDQINLLSSQSLNINNTNINNLSKNININNLYDTRLTTFINPNGYYLNNLTSDTTTNTYIQYTLWSSVCWSSKLSLYVAVCSDVVGGQTVDTRRVLTSNNGINWSIQNIPTNVNLNYVCWSDELSLFVAVGQYIITSTDGINWTDRVTTLPNTLVSVCWAKELSMFVAISFAGNFNRVMTSTDGINWTLRSTPGDCALKSICWSPELNLFVAVGSASTLSDRTLISTDGINWTVGNCGFNLQFNSICWSPEKMLFVAAYSAGFIYSSDGYNWTISSTLISSATAINPTCICWAKDIELFLAIDGTSNIGTILYSKNGLNWYMSNNINSSNTYNQIIWNPDYKQFIAVSAYTSSSARIAISNPLLLSTQNNLINSTITFNKSNNNIGINSISPNKLLEINSINGKCFKHFNNTDNTKYIAYDVSSDGQLNITVNKLVIPTNNSSYGLMLNNTLIKTTVAELNTYLSNNTAGTAVKSKPIVVDSSNNISGINILSCNSIIENGTTLSTSSNNQYFINATQGTASSSSALISDTSNNIVNINNISTNAIQINNSFIYSTNENLNTLQDKSIYLKDNIKRALLNLSPITTSSSMSIYDNAWSPELGLFIGVSLTNNRLVYSVDGIIWTNIVNNIINNIGVRCICWSSELGLFVAISSNGIVLNSYDGFNWSVYSIMTETNNYNSVCWAPEINLFVAVGSGSGTNRIIISNNGYDWLNVQPPNAYTWNKVVWSSDLNLFIAIASDGGYNSIIYSNDGLNWLTATIEHNLGVSDVAWSNKLKMFVAICTNISNASNPLLYSYNGKNWTMNLYPYNLYLGKIIWISELEIFIACTVTSAIELVYSYDGLNWSSIGATAYSSNIYNIIWSPELNIIVLNNIGNTTNPIYISGIITPSSHSTIKVQSNEFQCDNINGRIGLGITPSYQLHLSSDNAAKPSTSTWTVSSDERLKENIQNADINLCYNNIKNLRLVRYTWKDEVYTSDEVSDRSKLGWIAQEVETIFPKAVQKNNMYGYEDCRTLNTDQIITSMYGCLQKLINIYDEQSNELNNLNDNLDKLKKIMDDINQ